MAGIRSSRFRKSENDEDEEERDTDRKRIKKPRPARVNCEKTTGSWREERRSTEDKDEGRKDFGAFFGGKEIAYHSKSRDARTATTESLKTAVDEEVLNR